LAQDKNNNNDHDKYIIIQKNEKKFE